MTQSIHVRLKVPADMPLLDLTSALATRGYITKMRNGVLEVTRYRRRKPDTHNTLPPAA